MESKVPLLTEFALSRWGAVAPFARLGLGEQAATGGWGRLPSVQVRRPISSADSPGRAAYSSEPPFPPSELSRCLCRPVNQGTLISVAGWMAGFA